ncbi:MAG: preprotein translocase subunit SecG [Chlamydiales bacterium]|jgi:preprotein translocase subunit SecG|nr:preprotein translocase subunit SecG [Chlamydiales bacterium]
MFFYYTAFFVFILLCMLLCLVIMMQESKTSGLGGSFGGESHDSLFGVSTAEVLKKFTGWLVALFFIFCVLLSFWTSAIGRSGQNLDQLNTKPMQEKAE